MRSLRNEFNIHSHKAFLAVFHIKLHMIILFDLVNKATGMNKCFLAAIIMLNESETFILIKEFYGSLIFCVHNKKF